MKHYRSWHVAAIALVALVSHIALAPATNRGLEMLYKNVRKWQADRASGRYLSGLRQLHAELPAGFVDAIGQFNIFLTAHDAKLVVLLLPHPTDWEDRTSTGGSLLNRSGLLQQNSHLAGARLMRAELALKERGIKTINLLEGAYQDVARDPGLASLASDNFHYGAATAGVLATNLMNGFSQKKREKSGRDTLILGDCHAPLLVQQLNAAGIWPKIHVLWKNGGSNLLAREISEFPDRHLLGIHEVIWCLSDAYLYTGEPTSSTFPPLASSRNDTTRGKDGPRLVEVTLMKRTSAHTLRNGAPTYPNALIEYEFRSKEGEEFLGICYVMKNKILDNAVIDWADGQPLTLKLEPWDSAVAKIPALQHERILDDILNFTLPRYYVSGWMRPDLQWQQ